MFTLYDDKEILFVVRTVMGELVRTGRVSTQTEAWNMEKRALKECLVRLSPELEKNMKKEKVEALNSFQETFVTTEETR